MGDDIKKGEGDKPTAQVLRLVEFRKDLGPNGGIPPAGVVQPNAFEPEDEYQQLYVGATRDQGIIQPPYLLRTLDRLALENNTLSPCIETMVTNVDGTGYDFEADDEEADDDGDDQNVVKLKEFFAEPWPGMSFMHIRKRLRRDLERTGNAYIEVLRNAQDEVVFLRWVDAKMMRMLRLDDAIPITQKVTRGGKEVSIVTMTRERRYCQLVNGVSLMYFKEFGAQRDLHKKTAVWAPQGQRLPANARATEIIHLRALPDSHTPYGVPRWINQVPSVLGSRKSEEFNLEFFDNGGVPPVMIILQGGTLQAQTRKALEQKFSGEAKKSNRVEVIEVDPAGGQLNTATPQARVIVERFGADRQKDSMFENYDAKCSEKILRSFRLAPIFLGQAQQYNFATAFASYTVVEAQVFAPEREEFDEIMSMRLLPAMGFQGYRMRSKPMVIEDATLKLQGIEVISQMGDQVEPADIIDAINESCGLHLKVSDAAPSLQDKMDQAQQQQDFQNKLQEKQASMPQALPPGTTHTMSPNGTIKPINPDPKSPTAPVGAAGPTPNGGQPGSVKPKALPSAMGGNGTPKQSPSRKSDDEGISGHALAVDMLTALRKRDFATLSGGLAIVNGLDDASKAKFNEITTGLMFVDPSLDANGLSELCACTIAVMNGQAHANTH